MFATKVYPNKNTYQCPSLQKRKSREGDWMCINCSNYNYAFRDICNRCRMQTKDQNARAFQLIGKQNYGQRSFPSVLFLTLGSQKGTTERSNVGALKQRNQDQNQNNCGWVHDLIGE